MVLKNAWAMKGHAFVREDVAIGEDGLIAETAGGETHLEPRLGGFENVGVGDKFDLPGYLGLVELALGADLGAEIGDRRRGHQDAVARERRPDGFEHVARAHDVNALDSLGGGEVYGAGDQHRFVAAPGRRGGDGKAHFAGGRIGQEPYRVEIFARGTGRDYEAHWASYLALTRQNAQQETGTVRM